MNPEEVERQMDFILQSQANSVVRMDRLEENMGRSESRMDRFEENQAKLQLQIDGLREAARDLLRVSRRFLDTSRDHARRLSKLEQKGP